MNAKDKNYKSEVFSYFEKSKVNFLLEAKMFLFEQMAFKHIFAFVLKMCAFFKEHVREVMDNVFCVLCMVMVCLGSAVSWNCQDCNRQSMQ